MTHKHDDDVTLAGFMPETGNCLVLADRDHGEVYVRFDQACTGFAIKPELALSWGWALLAAAEKLQPGVEDERQQAMTQALEQMFADTDTAGEEWQGE